MGSTTSGEGDGILLYYKYTPLAGQEAEVKAWYEQLCNEQQQKGRIRVAADGINVTVSRAALCLKHSFCFCTCFVGTQ